MNAVCYLMLNLGSCLQQGTQLAKSLGTKFTLKWILFFFYDFEVHLFPNSVLGNVDVYHTLNVTWIYIIIH